MARVMLVRHGQASFGAADYDQLSALGALQCERLGEHWLAGGERVGTIVRGSLRRHEQSLAAMMRGMPGLHDAGVAVHEGLNEYDSDALIDALAMGPLPPVHDATAAREHFRRLREALLRWMQDDLSPKGMPSFARFAEGVRDALAQAHRSARDGTVLVVSSGGPISVALAHVLQAPSESAIALNMRMRNSAVSELASTARGFDLVRFNDVSHLLAPQITHA